jgi:hypothetical protein
MVSKRPPHNPYLLVEFDISTRHWFTITVTDIATTRSIFTNSGKIGPRKDMIELTKSNIQYYRDQDQKETARIVERCALDERLTILRESLRNASTKSIPLLQAVEEACSWMDECDQASVEDYRSRRMNLDALAEEAKLAVEQATITRPDVSYIVGETITPQNGGSMMPKTDRPVPTPPEISDLDSPFSSGRITRLYTALRLVGDVNSPEEFLKLRMNKCGFFSPNATFRLPFPH